MSHRRRCIVRRDAFLNLAVTRKGALATTAQSLFIWTTDASGLATGWVPASPWNP